MRRLLIASALATLPLPAIAGTGLSAEIGETGITATLARLSALPAPTDEERFAIGGLEFLGALERVYQLRWQVGMGRGFDMMFGMAGQLGNNPDPRQLDPAEITAILDDTLAGMERARATLGNIPDDSAFGFELDFADLWLDADGDGKRGLAESLTDIAGPAIFGWRWRQRQQAQGPLPVIRFDTADAPWLAAYTHLISGTTQMIRAYDPTPAIARVGEANAILRNPATEADPYGYSNFIDMFAIVDGTLRHEPDAARTVAARDHYLSMVSENRRFWALVAQETDNDREWIPNDGQVSATGLPFPKGIGTSWLAVLEDTEGLLTGRLAAPYPKDIFFGRPTADTPGLDISKLFTEPRPVDLVGWIQGWAALPYLSDAPQVTAQNMGRFEQLVSGDAPLFMVFLN
ncbi:hypothetical protein LZA78_10775 [Sinirhodobacter sp. WL0062]|uniref:DUF3131 domain-containing protein n=1 Tax=Rhodobacter flavimaris TaxID=2907145 RepID=A0ABS8YZB2_9RHOB|nr:hypothetical protein [Sinirhodobacter sp. WL0062]MCE5973967.1 hypothetical protein [Sinirhodobacter sp. WL0062]